MLDSEKKEEVRKKGGMDSFKNKRKVKDIVKGKGNVEKIKDWLWKIKNLNVWMNIEKGIIMCVEERELKNILRKIIKGKGGRKMLEGKEEKKEEEE